MFLTILTLTTLLSENSEGILHGPENCHILNKKIFSVFLHNLQTVRYGTALKVPKCEIFDRSDFHDFYSIKPFWVGDFGAKI